jgi:hypothetical protein
MEGKNTIALHDRGRNTIARLTILTNDFKLFIFASHITTDGRIKLSTQKHKLNSIS